MAPRLTESDPQPADESRGWDAYSVWRTRVLQPIETAKERAAPQGWDPYLVWMNRVKR